MNIHPIILLGLLFVSNSGFAQKNTSNSQLQSAIQEFVSHPDMKYASVGIQISEVATNKTVASHASNLSLIPASSIKVVTTATALTVLGKDYRFKTVVEHDGTLTDGILNGNLYIKGYGDPTLGSFEMEGVDTLSHLLDKMTKAIKAKGIKEINGQIVGDGTHYESAVNAPSWGWYDLGNYYGAGVSGLNVLENLYYLEFQLGTTVSKPPQIKSVYPTVPNLYFVNEVQSAPKGSGDNSYIYGAPRSYNRHIRGTLPIGNGTFKIKGSIPDPPYFLAYQLHQALRKAGIKTQGRTTTQLELNRIQAAVGATKSKQRTTIQTIKSPPMSEIVNRANTFSVNLYCEALLKAIGHKTSGKGTNEAGIEAIQAFWKGRGVNTDGWFMEDGSGLSPRNGITAKQLTAIMAKIAKDPNLYPVFKKSLPIAGGAGRLSYMLKGTPAAGKVRTKSGFMGRVRSYTGYVTTTSGKELAFTFIVNNHLGKSSPVRKKLEKLMVQMVNHE